jgi:hypothetical protein
MQSYPLSGNDGSVAVKALIGSTFDGLEACFIPQSWFHHICYRNGSPNLPAMVVLAEIVYWHRPIAINETDGTFKAWGKRFKGKYLQHNRSEYAQRYNLTPNQVTDALAALENMGLITRHILKRITLRGGKVLGNVPYVELHADKLKEITLSATAERYAAAAKTNTESTTESDEDAPKKKRKPPYKPQGGGPINYTQADLFAMRSDRVRSPAKKRSYMELATISAYEGGEE